MNLFGRSRRTPAPVTPDPDPIAFPDLATEAIAREEFEAADQRAAPVLSRIAHTGVILRRVEVDAERGSAVLTFADETQVTVATTGEEVLQLRSAARLTDTRLVYSHTRSDAPGRVLAFTAAHWTIYLLVGIAHV